jgi:hypothetical protein
MDSVSLDQHTEIVGLFDISISKVDNTIFIANKYTAEPGASNTFALYADETGKIKSSGLALMYEVDTETLTTSTIVSHNINANYVVTEHLNFLKKEGTGRFASIHTDFFKDHTLAIVTEHNDGTTGCALTIDGAQRVTIQDGKLNLKHTRTITSSVGFPNDQKGDLAIDNTYLYYCTRDFDKVSNIWVRWRISDKSW